jgi:hypoxanthine phosphoribosyltransferase
LTVLEQRLTTKKNRKVRRFRDLYPEIPLLVVYQRDFHQLLRQHDLRSVDGRAA